MSGKHVSVAAALLLPAIGLAWAMHALARAGLNRGRGATFAAVAIAGLGLGGGSDAAVPVARALVLAPYTVPAVGWGLAHGGEVHIQGNMIVVSGMSGGHGTFRAITVGQVILTSKDTLDPALLAHESVHGDQWALLGALTPPLYYLSDFIGGGPSHNIFEVSAGLEAGGYPA